MSDTIAGVATAPGEGGIAIVRLSGEDAIRLFEQVFRSASRKPPYESHRLMYGHVTDGGRVLDECMGVVMRAPHTYTREDVCELHTHGGAAAATLTLKLLIRLGARPAEAGEFTRRAFMNGRIDLSQAEAVMGIVSAQSEAALRAQEAQLEGGQSRFLRQAQGQLSALLSGLEAHIDYPDEIGEEEALDGLSEGLEKLCAFLEGAVDERGARILREGLRTALCGRPNAGKSTLFNALLGEERAIVASVPGTTRDVLEGSFSLDGSAVLLSDTAGLRETGDEVERIGVERARKTLRQADAALLLLDGSRPLDAEDEALLSQEFPCPCALLINKQDLCGPLSPASLAPYAQGRPIFALSAKTGEGIQAVKDYLRGFLSAPRQWQLVQERHLALARQAVERLRQAQGSLASGAPLDLAAIDLHEALYLLGRITGDSVDEQLLDDVFSRFCVGK